jgi:hypothetical protein
LSYTPEHQTSLPRDHAKFPGEFASSVRGYQSFTVKDRLHDLHASGEHDEEWDTDISRTEENLAGFDSPQIALRSYPLDLRRSQLRENLRAGIKSARNRPGSHVFRPANNLLVTDDGNAVWGARCPLALNC